MTKSWVSGGRSGELIERIRRELAELEAKRDELVEKHKRAVFDWVSFAISSRNKQSDTDFLWNKPTTQEIRQVVADYDTLNQMMLDKQALLNDKLDEQAKLDSLG